MPFYYNGTFGNSGSGGSVSPSSFGGRKLGELTVSGTGILPATTQDYNYYTVSRSAVLPITVDGLTLSNKHDFVLFQGGRWIVQSVTPNTQSTQVENIANESLSGTATTQQEANIEFTNEIKDLKTRSFRTIGYCGSTQPLQAREDDIFYQTNATSSYGSDLPTNFPIQVYRWNNGAWSTNTENWTPDVNDVIINININPPIAFVWQNGWSPTTQGLSTTDNITIDRNNNGELQVKDNGITFLKLDPNAVATQNENSTNKVVRADAMYNTAITKNFSQIKAKTGGGKEIEIDLQNEANVSKTKVNIDLDETATQNSNNPITSNGVWKEELNNTNSSQACIYDATSKKLQLTTQLKNNNNDSKVNKTTNLISKGTDYVSLSDTDKLSYLNITTQELKDVALSAINTYIQDKLKNGAISTVLTSNLTANKILNSNANGKITASYDLKTSTGSSATDTEIPTNKLLYDNTKKLTTNSFTNSRGVYVDSNGNLATESVNLTAKTTAGLTQHKISQRGLITEYTSIGVNRSLNIASNNLGINNTITANTTDGIKTFKVNANGLITGYTAKTLGRGLKDDTNVIGHSNTAITAKTNTNIAGVSYDAYGHITGKGTEYSVQTSMPSSPTDSQFLTAKAVYDGFAPRQTTYISGENSVFIDANDAVFNFPTTTPNTRAVDIRQFLVTLIDPFSNATIWGNCETRIIVNNHDGDGAGIEVYQTVICIGNTSKFYRKGTLKPAQDITKIYENRSNIVWWDWYPIDYPIVYLSNLLNKTDFNDGGYIALTITGGVALFELDFISPKSTRVKDIIVTTEFGKYSKFFKSTGRATLGNSSNPLNGGILMVRAERNSSLKCSRAGTANNDYDGQLVVTLGY